MIQPPDWTYDQSKGILGALCSIASLHATAPISPAEKELIEGVRIIILGHPEIEHDDEEVHIKPAELAALFSDSDHKARAAELIAMMPYVVRPFSDSKTYISEKFLEQLGENTHRIEDFLGAREKHMRNQEYCALRKLGRDVFPYEDPEGRYKEVLKLLKEAEGDPEELERYQSLESYPAGSLGRGYFDFYAQFDWPLPGDPLWISEDLTVRHDLVHVLGPYDISINGEFQVAGFSAGNSTTFNWMVAMLGFCPPYVSTGQQCCPQDFVEAYLRGKNAKASFVDQWDFWPYMEQQISDIQNEFGI
ncbi:MAG: hypothetical protein AAGJ81_04765 [Verrucomicrobiota bacterium]